MRHFWVFMFSCCCKTRKILWVVCSMSSCWAHVEHGLSWPCATQCWAHAEPMQSPCWPRAQCMFHTTFHSQCMPVRNWAWVEAERWTTTWHSAHTMPKRFIRKWLENYVLVLSVRFSRDAATERTFFSLWKACTANALREQVRQMLCTLRFVKPGRAWTCYKQIMQNWKRFCDLHACSSGTQNLSWES